MTTTELLDAPKSDTSVMANPMLREFTTCGRCDVVCDACLVVTVKTVHNGYGTVELCSKCLHEMALVIDALTSDIKKG